MRCRLPINAELLSYAVMVYYIPVHWLWGRDHVYWSPKQQLFYEEKSVDNKIAVVRIFNKYVFNYAKVVFFLPMQIFLMVNKFNIEFDFNVVTLVTLEVVLSLNTKEIDSY